MLNESILEVEKKAENPYFTFEEALEQIDAILDLQREDAEIGAQILVHRAENLKNLHSIATINFIRQLLPTLIKQKKPVPCIDKPEQLEPLDIDQYEEVFSPLIISDYKKSERELKNTKKFMELTSPARINANKRLNAFTIVLGAPDLPRRHPGVDDRYHPEKDIDLEWLDLIEHGNNSLKYNLKHSKKACPNLIFLRCPVQKTEDELTKQIHQKNTLDYYKSNITSENQHPIEFHFAGHGNPNEIGAMSQEKRYTPEELANYFNQIVEASEMKELLLEKSRKQPLIFRFDVCNPAYVALSQDDLNAPNLAEIIEEKVLNESIIGKFYKEMIFLGYDNIKVIGYRGFMQNMITGAGATVKNSLADATVETASSNAAHSVETGSNGEPKVTLPKDLKFASFEVDSPSAPHNIFR